MDAVSWGHPNLRGVSSYEPGLHNMTEVRGGQLRKEATSEVPEHSNSTTPQGRTLLFCSLKGIWAKLWDAEQKNVDLVNNISHPVGQARNQNVASAFAAVQRVFRAVPAPPSDDPWSAVYTISHLT